MYLTVHFKGFFYLIHTLLYFLCYGFKTEQTACIIKNNKPNYFTNNLQKTFLY